MTCYYKASYDDGKLSVSVDGNTINLFYKGQDQELTDQPDLLCHALDTLIEAQAEIAQLQAAVRWLANDKDVLNDMLHENYTDEAHNDMVRFIKEVTE